MTLLPGSTAKIEWTFDDNITVTLIRAWSFTSTDGTFKRTMLARIIGDGSATIFVSFPVIAVEKPSKLVLKNVDRRYDGKYKFHVLATFNTESEVTVIIVGKFLLIV